MFLGVVDDPRGPAAPGQREVSFLGHQDFGVVHRRGARDRLRRDRARRPGAASPPSRSSRAAIGVILDASVFVYLGVAPGGGRRRAGSAAALGTLTLRRGLALGGDPRSSSAPACTSYGDPT